MAIVIVGMWSASNAEAHSTLVEACPDRGNVTNEVTELELTFSSPLIEIVEQPAVVELLISGTEDSLELSAVQFVTDRVLRVSVLESLESGLYVVRYQVLSRDLDLNDGGFQFRLDRDEPNPDECGDLNSGSSRIGLLVLVVSGIGVLALSALLLRSRNSTGKMNLRM